MQSIAKSFLSFHSVSEHCFPTIRVSFLHVWIVKIHFCVFPPVCAEYSTTLLVKFVHTCYVYWACKLLSCFPPHVSEYSNKTFVRLSYFPDTHSWLNGLLYFFFHFSEILGHISCEIHSFFYVYWL